MDHVIIQYIIYSYAFTGVVGLFGYVPTMIDLWHGKKSANAPSYLLWTLCGLIGLLYGIFILHDALYNVITFLHLFACAAILIMRVRLPK